MREIWVADGVSVTFWASSENRLVCCDCGLTHKMKFECGDAGSVIATFWRDEKKTEEYRKRAKEQDAKV